LPRHANFSAMAGSPYPYPRSKAPVIPDWPNFRVEGDAAPFFSSPRNIGVQLGDTSGGVEDKRSPRAVSITSPKAWGKGFWKAIGRQIRARKGDVT
jgi:hypothetical protein